MTDNIWTVLFRNGGYPEGGVTTERVTADAWTVGPSGDLVFYNSEATTRQGIRAETQFPVRGFAAGVWVDVSLFA